MDIKELDKRQLILLTLLITFVVSIATGIVTVSLMNQMPKSVPQTINNVIQKTIERVTTVEVPAKVNTSVDKTKESGLTLLGDGDAIVSIYLKEGDISTPLISPLPEGTQVIPPVDNTNINNTTPTSTPNNPKELGQGIIISDIGLVLVDSSILTDSKVYKIILNKTDFDATILKKFTNGFTILKISEKKAPSKTTPTTEIPTKTN